MTSSRSHRRAGARGRNAWLQSQLVLDAEPMAVKRAKGSTKVVVASPAASTKTKKAKAKAPARKEDATDALPSRLRTARSASASARAAVKRAAGPKAPARPAAHAPGTPAPVVWVGDIVVADIGSGRHWVCKVTSVSPSGIGVAWARGFDIKVMTLPLTAYVRTVLAATVMPDQARPLPGVHVRVAWHPPGGRVVGFTGAGRAEVELAGTGGVVDLPLDSIVQSPTAARRKKSKVPVTTPVAASGSQHRSPQAPRRRPQTDGPLALTPPPPPPPKSTATPDPFPIGATVRFASGGRERTGTVRRYVGGGQVLVAYATPNGTLTRPVLLHRLRRG